MFTILMKSQSILVTCSFTNLSYTWDSSTFPLEPKICLLDYVHCWDKLHPQIFLVFLKYSSVMPTKPSHKCYSL